MMYSEVIKNQVYVYRNGELIYKKWLDQNNSVVFNKPPNWKHDKTNSIMAIKIKQLSEKGTIYHKVKLAEHMLDTPSQPNDYVKAIISTYKNRVRVEWVNGCSAIVDGWKDLNVIV